MRRRSRPQIGWVVLGLLISVMAAGVMIRSRAADPGAPSDIAVTGAMVAETPLGFAAAVYLTIEQRGGDDRLIGASSPIADRTTLHEMTPLDGGGLMLATDAIEVAVGSTVSLAPFGSHVMLEDLIEPLVVGAAVPLTLVFDRSAPVEVLVEVIDLDRLATLGED